MFRVRTALLVAVAFLAIAAPAHAADSVTVSLSPSLDLSFPFWCDWGYDSDERCYRDDSDRLPIGGAENKVWRAGLRFELPRNANVLSAELRLYFDGTCVGAGLSSRPCDGRSYQIDARPIASSDWFHEREVETWPVVATAELPPFARSQWLAWDVSDLVWSWSVDDMPNNGILLQLSEAQEAWGAGGPRLPSSAFADASRRPRLVLTYQELTP
jgi:hypothetical protein